MRHPLDTPTVTAHALGELSSAEERLLRMTFHSPAAAQRLEEHTEAMMDVSIRLRDALKQENLPLRLSQERRDEILAGAGKFTRKRASMDATASLSEPKSQGEILRERKQFDSRPSRLATYITLGSVAAAVVIFISIKPLITGLGTGTEAGRGTSAGNGSANPDESTTARFNILPENTKTPKKLTPKPPQSLAHLPMPIGDPAPIPVPPSLGPKQGPDSTPPAIVNAEPPKAPPAPPVVQPKQGGMQFTKDPKAPVFTSPK